MKYLSFTLLGALCLGMSAWADELIRPNTKIGATDVGGLSRQDARMKLRVWWDVERREMITLTSDKLKKQPEPRSETNWGLVLNDQKSVDSLPPEAFYDSATTLDPDAAPKPIQVDVILDFDPTKMATLLAFLKTQQPPSSTSAAIHNGKLTVKNSTQIEYYVTDEEMKKALLEAVAQPDHNGTLPLREKKTKVDVKPEAAPVEVMSSFKTHYPVGQADRNANLGLASKKIDGTVIMPGEIFSFNKVVGKRTEAAGFHEAGVYVNGRHDTGIGGGCCQVSTTLYNAALLADLKIIERNNHSLPVAYVPQGRDATVSWGSYDMQFQNNKPYPIAIQRSAFGKGWLGFTILGKKENVEVKLVSKKLKTWSFPPQYEVDSDLKRGQREVREKGAPGSMAQAWREVYVDGKLVRRDNLGTSTYKGGPMIIAVGPGTPHGGSVAHKRGSGALASRPSVAAPSVSISSGKPTAIVPVRRGG